MLAWAVVEYGQTARFVAAPNYPTALTMLKPGERIAGPGRQLHKVPLWYRENAITTYEKDE